MHTIISKRPTSFIYTKWSDSTDHVVVPEYSIRIEGGSHVINPKTLVTPYGVATIVDDDTLAKLKAIPKFNKDVERGLIRIESSTIKDTDKIDSIATSGKMIDSADIKTRPLTPEDLENDGAVVNSDGSIDISNGGKNAMQRRGSKGIGRRKKANK